MDTIVLDKILVVLHDLEVDIFPDKQAIRELIIGIEAEKERLRSGIHVDN